MYEDLTNDHPANTSTPGTIAIGRVGDWGQVSPSGDADWFRVSLTAGQQYVFRIEAGATNGLFDPQLGIYSFAGQLLIQATVGQGFQSKYVEYTPTATADYFMVVNGAASVVGTYRISASKVGSTFTGTAGNDTFAGGTLGEDTFSGGTGIDTIVFASTNYSGHTLRQYNAYQTISSSSYELGNDQLTGIERLQFSDVKVALDLGVTQSAGQALLLTGAVLPGQLAVDASKQALLGTVIGLFDSGYSMRDLSGAMLRLPIWTVLTNQAAPTNSDIASYLLSNVYGHAPDQATLDAAVTALDTESFQGEWLASLAQSSSAQTHIALATWASIGLTFV